MPLLMPISLDCKLSAYQYRLNKLKQLLLPYSRSVWTVFSLSCCTAEFTELQAMLCLLIIDF